MLVPKAEELVANPYRHDGARGSEGVLRVWVPSVFAYPPNCTSRIIPITVCYAFKQSEADDRSVVYRLGDAA